MNNEINAKRFAEEWGKVAKMVDSLNEDGAKTALFCTLMTMKMSDQDGKIMELYEKVTDIYLKAAAETKRGV